MSDTSKFLEAEFDINQTLANGNTVIFGLQCNLSSNKWQYTTNLSGAAHWNDSAVSCTRAQWTANTWHHVVLNSHRDLVGTVTYDSECFDGACQSLGAVGGNSAFSLGFTPLGNIFINAQIDGDNSSSSTVMYLDGTTLNRY